MGLQQESLTVTLDPQRWKRVEAIFDRVVELGASEREHALTNECGSDLPLRAEIEALLRADSETAALLDMPASDAAGPLLSLADALPEADRSGEIIGPYRLLHRLGRGGMGDVFLAERADGQFEQRVALKFVRRDFGGSFLVRRFMRERQILARLQHPKIARLLDGGISKKNEPYFAMEYVPGASIVRFCQDGGLELPARLNLFLAVCEAVQHAHRNLVVHGDLKPSNILVTVDGQVKLLDFGIARMIEAPAGTAGGETLTRSDWRPFTPEYAAPEQVRGEPISTTTDVYALGAVLYELLAQRRAVEIRQLTAMEIERAVCATEPATPSRVAPSGLARRLRGDLDTIVLKALAKAPERRYASVEALSDDLRRHLDGRPVAAQPDSLVYRSRKFARRHRLGMAAAAVLLISIMTGIGAALWQASVVARESARVRQVQEFMLGLFQSSDPDVSRGRDITARELLDRGSRRIELELAGQPNLQVELWTTVGDIYRKLGLYDRAKPLLEKAAEHARISAPGGDERLATALAALSAVLREQSDLDRAEALQQQALALRIRLFGREDARAALSLRDLAAIASARGRFDDSERLYRQALAIDRRAYGDEHPLVATDLDNLGVTLWRKGAYEQADLAYRDSLRLRRKLLDSTHPDLVTTLGNLAVLRSSQARYDESVALQKEVLHIRRKIYGNEHPDVALSLTNLAVVLDNAGRFSEAQSYQQKAYEIRRKVLGPHNPDTIINLNGLAVAAFRRGDFPTAAAAMRTVAEQWRKSLGERAPAAVTALNNLGVMLTELERYAEAETMLRSALSLRREVLGSEHPDVGQSLRNIAVVLYRTGRHREAEAAAREALHVYEISGLPQDHPRRADVAVTLGGALLATHRPAEAEAVLREAAAIRRATFGESHPDSAETQALLGVCLSALGRAEEGEPLLRAGYTTLTFSPAHINKAKHIVKLRSATIDP
jgi:serine/threonine-protein kinase